MICCKIIFIILGFVFKEIEALDLSSNFYCEDNNTLKMGNKCIFLGKSVNTYSESLEVCKIIHRSGSLISIHSLHDQVILHKLIELVNHDVWIGFMAFSWNSKTYSWIDKSAYNFSFWASGEPITNHPYDHYGRNNNKMYCVKSKRRADKIGSSGTWYATNCNVALFPVCSKPYYTPRHQLQNCTHPLEEYFENNLTCYLEVEEKMNWANAEKYCQSRNGHLISINDFEEQNYVWNKMKITADQDIWLGLISTGGAPFKWSNRIPVIFKNWAEEEPHTTISDRCTLLHSKTGDWFTNPCNEKKPFICSHKKEIRISNTNMKGFCPKNWTDFGSNHCYYFQKNITLSWRNALKWCDQENATLASIHNTLENNLLSLFVHSYNDKAWIGLHNKLNVTRWSDWTSLNFTVWAPNESINDQFDCGVLSHKKNWMRKSCNNNHLPFICKRKKTEEKKRHQIQTDNINDHLQHANSNNMDEDKESSHKSSFVVPAFIIIPCLLFITGGVGLAYVEYYNIWKKKKLYNQKLNKLSLAEIESSILSKNSSDEDISETNEAVQNENK